MPITVGQILEDAQGRVPFYTREAFPLPRQRLTLTDLHRRLLQKVQQVEPAYLLTSGTIPGPLSVAQGQALPALTHLLDVTSTNAQGTKEDVMILHPGMRLTITSPRRAVYLANGKLELIGDDADWSGITVLTYRYVPVAPTFATDADTPTLGDPAVPALTARMAEAIVEQLIMAQAVDPAVGEAALGFLRPRAGEAEALYLSAIRGVGLPRTLPTVEVW